MKISGDFNYRPYRTHKFFFSPVGKALQSPMLVLMKPRKNKNTVSCRLNTTEIMLKAAQNTISRFGSNATMFVQCFIWQLLKKMVSSHFANFGLKSKKI